MECPRSKDELMAEYFEGRRVVAGMATMPTRLGTFPAAFNSIIDQIDHLYLYLDGHTDIPEPANGHPRVTTILADAVPGLHANGKFIALALEQTRCLYLGADDDISYPPTYVRGLRAALAACGGRAVVGYHGAVFARPFVSYRHSRKVRSFDQGLDQPTIVDLLGTGTVMFDTAALRFEVRNWTDVNLLDLNLAVEAAKAGLPLVCLPRARGYICPLAADQPDSIYMGLKRDDTRQTELALELLALKSTLGTGSDS
jgi:hypothetical protein